MDSGGVLVVGFIANPDAARRSLGKRLQVPHSINLDPHVTRLLLCGTAASPAVFALHVVACGYVRQKAAEAKQSAAQAKNPFLRRAYGSRIRAAFSRTNGYSRESGRFPGPLFLLSLGLLGARRLGNYSEGHHATCNMKAPWMDYGVVELAALAALSALGCAFAAGRAELLFVALFGRPV